MNGPAQALFLRRLAATRDGRLELRLPDGKLHVFGDPRSDLRAVVEIRDPGVFRRFVFGGDVAFGETYAEGRWTSPDLPSVVRLGVRNMRAFDAGRRVTSILSRLGHRLHHAFRRNTVSGSRFNIRFHYDLGTDFYSLFLDPTLTYSCGIFETPQTSLAQAQLAKLDRICQTLELAPGDRLIEIGSGWGAFAMHAAQPLRLPGHDDDHQPLPVRLRPRAARARRPGAGASSSSSRTTASSPGSTTRPSRSRCSRPSGSPSTTGSSRRWIGSCAQAARCCSRRSG